MSTQPIAAYSFLPWARNGLGVFIRESDPGAPGAVRGTIDVTLRVTGTQLDGNETSLPIPKAVELYGPGDVIGIDPKAIVRSEPRHWITNFEPNYMPFVEFYDEDFPWRYTPAKPSPDNRRLRPWLTLLVLVEGEFDDRRGLRNVPLPFIDVADPASVFPRADELWAWAHVHVNGGLGVDAADTAALATRLDQVVAADRDLAYSRLLGPRILTDNTAYHAFLVPTFETGRLAGLGREPDTATSATQSAWDPNGRPDPTAFPFYHRWYFRTGTVGDFEYLVRLLQPRTVDPRVGRRDVDVLDPRAGMPAIDRFGGVLRLGGALRAPLLTLDEDALAEYNAHETWGDPYPHSFQTALATLVNLADDYAQEAAGTAHAAAEQVADDIDADGLKKALAQADEDPLIVPPLYGRWHAETHRLVPPTAPDIPPDDQPWVHELNLDPRHRVAAGFGTSVVQRGQEDFMEAAWQQVGEVLEGNRTIRRAQVAKAVSTVWHERELVALRETAPEHFLAVAAPIQRRVLASGLTVQHRVRQSPVPAAAMSTQMRKALRPRGRVARRVGFDGVRGAGNLLSRLNAGEVSAAPPKVVAPNLPTGDKLADELGPAGVPAWLVGLLLRYPWLRFAPLVVALALVLLLLLLLAPAAAVIAGAVLLVLGFLGTRYLGSVLRRARAADALRPASRTPAAVDELPTSPDFELGPVGEATAPRLDGSDSADAERFKESLRNVYELDAAERTIEPVVREPLDLEDIASTAIEGIRPARTIATRVLGKITIPGRIAEQLPGLAVDPFGEVMVYPEIDVPMYEPLKEISSELFLPNIQLIENNSVTLLETNQKFIEAYMVGLNHEFSRELLWREYPTDQRGSYFRQFWDVRGFLAATADPEALRERLRDIPELHTWPPDTPLGAHDHREAQGDKEDEVVLVIRGELLKKYPTAVVYAHRAEWERTAGAIDKSKPRQLVELTPAQAADPPRDLVKSPLYEAKVEPDIYFFGFDLTAKDAKGGPVPGQAEDDPGWFFVIKERPGEPRFGLDMPKDAVQPTINTWNELAWSDVVDPLPPSGFLRPGVRTLTLTDPVAPEEAHLQYEEDRRFAWRPDTHAAELAYILYQVPVLMAVHGAEMLKKLGPDDA
jgi:hypothetical protein